MSAEYKRLQLCFSQDNEEQMKYFDKMEGLGRQKTKLIVMALKEFMESYNLADKTTKEIKEFIRIYPYLSSIKNKASFMDMDLSSLNVTSNTKTSSKKKTSATASAEEMPVPENKPVLSNEAKSSMASLLSKFENM